MEKNMEVGGTSPSSDALAQCIAAYFLNPNIKTPITVGITGGCSEGVTSLMDKIKEHLLLTAAQAAFPGEGFNGDPKCRAITEKGKGIRKGVCNLSANRNPGEYKENDQRKLLVDFLEEFQPEHEAVYKSLACVELEQLQKCPVHERDGKIARVLTVNFSARNYKGTLEACDGLAVEITKEIEQSLTRAQRWSTFWRHRRENSQSSYSIFNLFCLALAFVVVWIASVVWMFLNGVNLTEWKKLKYGSIPATVMAIFVPALKLSVSFFKMKPVSQYLSLRFSSENSEQYGQQQKVISDIKFLKEEIGRKPYAIFSFIAGEKFNFWRGLLEDKIERTPVPKFGSAPQDKLRIIAFLNDLDQYEDSVMVRVLQVLNTVLKVCEINFILALDKNIIANAFQASSEIEEDVDHFISKIVQFPVTLVHPAVDEWVKKDSPIAKDEALSTENNGFVSNGQVDTTNDIEKGKQLTSTIECKKKRQVWKRVTQVQEMSKMINSEEEIATFRRLNCFASEIPKLRQSYTKYHKFARNVISQTMESDIENSHQWKAELVGWKVELVAWIFICSQWRHEMNILIKDWHTYIDVKDENEKIKQQPSLKEIVANYIKKQDDSKEEKKKEHMTRLKDTLATIQDTPKKVSFGYEEMQLRDVLPRWVLKMGTEVSMLMEKEKKKMDEEKEELDRWYNLHKALKLQDVSMKSIQWFQHFRFHCGVGYLTPLDPELLSN